MSEHNHSHEHHHEHEHCNEHEHCREGCCGDCGCSHGEHDEESRVSKILLAVSAALVLISLIPMNEIVRTVIAGIAVALSAYPIFRSAIKNFPRLSLAETELMLIAVIAACCLGEFREAALVAILYRLGEMLEDRAVERSRKSIDAVSKIQQDFAHLVRADGTTEKVHARDVKTGSIIKVLPHERFPIDGTVCAGASSADASAITGESLPVELGEGSAVRSGMMNGSGELTVITTEEFGTSTASRIVAMVEEAAEKKGKTQKFITKFAKIYTPAVVVIAVLIATIPSLITKNPSEWIYRALVFLVASCPCALVISVPLGFYTGLGAAAKRGIIVKGTAFAETFAKAKAVVFDKTGTLTTGDFEIDKITSYCALSEEQVLTLAAAAEHFSSHPIAKSIVKSAPEIDEAALSDFSESAGTGASVLCDGKRIYCGGVRMLENLGLKAPTDAHGEIFVCTDGEVLGSIKMKSTLRPDVAQMLTQLKAQGIERTVMLTGDNEQAAREVADECGIDEMHCNLLPDKKLEKLEEIKQQYGRTVYVGDGINDAPVLAAADVGIAMGLGTQAASEAADVILTNDRLDRLPEAHRLFKSTNNTVRFNIIFSIVVKLAVLICGAFGVAPVFLAVFADVGVCLICVAISSLIGSGEKNSF